MDRLFRDLRFALLWVVGISALAAAYFAEGGGQELLQSPPQPESQATDPASAGRSNPAEAAAPVAEGEEQQAYGEPVMDTTGVEPSPPEPGESASPAAQGAGAPGPEEQ